VSKPDTAAEPRPRETKPISPPGKGPIKVMLAGKNANGDSRSTAAATRT